MPAPLRPALVRILAAALLGGPAAAWGAGDCPPSEPREPAAGAPVEPAPAPDGEDDRIRIESEGADSRYRLEVELDDNITGFGIRGDSAATRERRTLRARYRLVELATGAVVLDATAGSDAGIDVVSSQYATVAAEQTALERLSDVVADQIVGRLAMFVTRAPPPSR